MRTPYLDDSSFQTALHIDIMNILLQAGSRVIPQATGLVTITPGPQTQDGFVA